MSDIDMTEEDFDRRWAAGTPVTVVSANCVVLRWPEDAS